MFLLFPEIYHFYFSLHAAPGQGQPYLPGFFHLPSETWMRRLDGLPNALCGVYKQGVGASLKIAQARYQTKKVTQKKGKEALEKWYGGGDLDVDNEIESTAESPLSQAASSGARETSRQRPVISYGIWHPTLARTEVTVMKGIHFSSMGHSAPRVVADEHGVEKLQKRLELLPEEAIYLIERGSMFCWKESDLRIEGTEGVPMTVQQAYSEMSGTEDLDLEKFQVYAYLKRLGYVVTRSPPSKRTLPPSRALFRGLFTTLSRPFTQINWWHPLRINSCFFGITSYSSLFRSLRFIPSRHPAPHRRDPSTQKSSPYQIFYNVYKPSTPFKKSSPPAPDFQIVVIKWVSLSSLQLNVLTGTYYSARTTPMPTLQELTDLFGVRPEEPLPLPRKKHPGQQGSKPGASATPPAVLSTSVSPSFLQRMLPRLFPAPKERPRHVNPFVALKAGKKMVVIAVVDSGNVGFFRFSEGAFDEWPMA
ncbi:hypothetical protein NMY22_g19200 [Coprinellus aureogranulatus]|nr:hypothetical protein NMY22_g19200 [Coprinellus aureogranulatus]